jgi:hypothetical protein
MAALQNALVPLLVIWGVVTAILICVLIYRSMLSNREEDQIFLDNASDGIASEQRALVMRIEKLGRPIAALVVVSAALLVAVAGLWIWQGLQSF